MPRRVCTFAVAHTDISAQPFNNAARTVRIFAPNNLSGSAVTNAPETNTAKE